MNVQHETSQIRQWRGDFGKAYTDRNTVDLSGLDALYQRNYGITRSELNRSFMGTVPTTAKILEIGCNIGNQLLALHQLGFTHLHGIEIQTDAVRQATRRLPDAHFCVASAFSIPFSDRYFDLVFTSGVLIHIAPPDLASALEEIHRTAKTWIWGFEYYSPTPAEVMYRGHQSLLWKNDFAQQYLTRFADIELARERHLKYLDNQNIDSMFLLRRRK